MSEKIAAVVVTYNRKELLVKCLDALMGQTRPLDRIILIDNNSNDGTRELLETRRYLNNFIIDYVCMPKNTGGSGGFHEGVKRAFSAGFDWLWLMDDDGCPDLDCLCQLVAHSNKYEVLGPLIISTEDESVSSFPYLIEGKENSSIEELEKYEIIMHVQPFNGVFIKKRVIEAIGFPDHRFFIWGDEEDYRFRWLKSGFRDRTVVRARFKHPKDRQKLRKVIKGSMPLIIVDSNKKKFLYYRNRFYNLVRYHGGLLKRAIKIFLSIVVVMALEPAKKVAALGLYDGFFGKFDRPLDDI